jgi:hypothetical protein
MLTIKSVEMMESRTVKSDRITSQRNLRAIFCSTEMSMLFSITRILFLFPDRRNDTRFAGESEQLHSGQVFAEMVCLQKSFAGVIYIQQPLVCISEKQISYSIEFLFSVATERIKIKEANQRRGLKK